MLVSCIGASGAGLRGGPRCRHDLVFCVYWLRPNSLLRVSAATVLFLGVLRLMVRPAKITHDNYVNVEDKHFQHEK